MLEPLINFTISKLFWIEEEKKTKLRETQRKEHSFSRTSLSDIFRFADQDRITYG